MLGIVMSNGGLLESRNDRVARWLGRRSGRYHHARAAILAVDDARANRPRAFSTSKHCVVFCSALFSTISVGSWMEFPESLRTSSKCLDTSARALPWLSLRLL